MRWKEGAKDDFGDDILLRLAKMRDFSGSPPVRCLLALVAGMTWSTGMTLW
jgi:hypothetical protein